MKSDQRAELLSKANDIMESGGPHTLDEETLIDLICPDLLAFKWLEDLFFGEDEEDGI